MYTPVDEIPNRANVISSRWVFKFKIDEEGKYQKGK